MLNRLRLVSLFALLMALLMSLFGGLSESYAKTCVKSESASEGPFYLDAENRKKIYRSGEGYPLTLKLRVINSSCKAVVGAVVSVWHADSSGVYSAASGKGALNFRGYRVSDRNGRVEFSSLFPGWYPGRAAHIHVNVYKDGVKLLSTQLYFKQSVVNSVYKTKPYSKRGLEDTTRDSDGLFKLLINKGAHVLSSKISNGSVIAIKDIVVG